MANERPPSRIEQISLDKQKRLSELETQYLRAREYVKSEQFTADQVKALEKVARLINYGDISTEKAMLILGRVQQILLDTYQHELVVLEYEDIKKTLAEMFPKEK